MFDEAPIEVESKSLQDKMQKVKIGDTQSHIKRLFEGKSYKIEHREDKDIYFWRFKIVDAIKQPQYEIYMGEFENGILTFGSILPKG